MPIAIQANYGLRSKQWFKDYISITRSIELFGIITGQNDLQGLGSLKTTAGDILSPKCIVKQSPYRSLQLRMKESGLARLGVSSGI